MKVLKQAGVLFRKAQDTLLSLTQKLEMHQNLVPTKSHISGAFFLPLPLLPLKFSCLSSSVVMMLLYVRCVLISSQPISVYFHTMYI